MSTHIYHYNINSEQRFFLGKAHQPLFDLIALSGNIVSHTPTGIAGFVATVGKEFFVDPQTHAFQHATINLKRDISDKENDEGPIFEFKPSIVRLAKEHLKAPFSDVISEDTPLSPSMFLDASGSIDQSAIDQMCSNVLSFQRDILFTFLSEDDKEFMNSTEDLCPKFLLSPYFYISPSNYTDWLRINIECYRTSKGIADRDVYFPVVVSKRFLEHDHTELIKAIDTVRLDGVYLWIDDHEEESLQPSQIDSYIALLKELRSKTQIILNSHGGYLSVLLCHADCGSILSGVGHSVNYGESRSVIPVGGGIPMARFYFPSIHSRLRFTDALEIIRGKGWLSSRQAFVENVCNCEQCRELLDAEPDVNRAFLAYGQSKPITFERRTRSGHRQLIRLDYPTAEAKRAAARHYLFCKNKEFEALSAKSFSDLRGDLKITYDNLVQDIDDRSFVHLDYWYKGLNQAFKA